MEKETPDELLQNLTSLEEVNALMSQINEEGPEVANFSEEEKQEVFSFLKDKLSEVKTQIDNLDVDQAKHFEENFKDAVDEEMTAVATNLQTFDGDLYATYITPIIGYFTSIWDSLKTKFNSLVGNTQDTPTEPTASIEPTTPEVSDATTGPTFAMMQLPEKPPYGGSSSYVPEPPAGRNYNDRPVGRPVSVNKRAIDRATRPISPQGGPQYYVRAGFNRYSPAVEADLASGQQLFMKNPNPALRAVYPYVKVDSMVKKARRATPA